MDGKFAQVHSMTGLKDAALTNNDLSNQYFTVLVKTDEI